MSTHTPSHSPGHASGGHATGAHPHGDHPLVGHLVPLWILFATGTVLIILTVVTVAAHAIDLGEFNIVIALAIAVVKATLVGMFFMHLRWDRPFNQLVFVGSVIFVVLLLWFCMMDTKQYQQELVVGNPKLSQAVLDTQAPTAPIAAEAPRYR